MELICDYREKGVYKKLNNIIENNNKYIQVVCKQLNLSLGDFTFGNVVIERKTHQDLASSILDGRYKEQCYRLEELKKENPNIKIFYFIEGNFDLYYGNHNIDKEKLISSIISLLYEKNFSVILTKHLNETCDFLLKFCKKYYEKYQVAGSVEESNADEIEQSNLQNLIRQNRKKNNQINKDNVGIMMLCNVPNISMTLAIELLKPFGNDIYKFIHELRENENYLYNLKIEGKNGKMRKLNKNICDTLNEYFNESQEIIVEDLDHQHQV